MTISVPVRPPSNPILTTVQQISRIFAQTPTTTAWGVANQARYVPIIVPRPITVVKLLAYNGTSVAGNSDMGLYREDGTEVVGIAAAAQSGTSGWQEFNITDTPILAGLYYIGLLNDGTTGQYFCFTNKELGRAYGVFSQAVGAANLPSPSATFAALDSGVIPVVGLSTRVTI